MHNRRTSLLLRMAVPAFVFCGLVAPSARGDDPNETLRDNDAGVQDQLDEDVTPLPAGMGALFVPSLTDAGLEPVVLVFHGGERVAAGRTGERIVLPPGDYQVVVGQGPRAGRAEATAKVIDGITTPLRPFFGALRVAFVDEDGHRLAGHFVVASADQRDVYGPVELAARDAERAPSLLLPPGDYVLVVGEAPRARRDSFALRVAAGEVLRYRLVMDEDRVIRTEFGETDHIETTGIWRLRWILGGSASLTQQENQFAGLNGSAAQLGAFSRLEGGLDTGNHLALLTFNVNEQFLGLDSKYGMDVPLRSIVNEAEAELLYNFRMGRILGPYGRGLARTSFFQDHYFPDQDVSLITRNEDGEVVRQSTASLGDRVKLLDAFAPLTFQEGAGLGLTIVDNRWAGLVLRGGVAARQAMYRDGRFVSSRDGNIVNLVRLDDNERYGAEVTAIGRLRIFDTLAYESRFDSFIPKRQIADGDTLRPIFRWDNTIPLRLSREASLVYTFSLRRDELVLDELQIMQGLAVRFQHVLF